MGKLRTVAGAEIPLASGAGKETKRTKLGGSMDMALPFLEVLSARNKIQHSSKAGRATHGKGKKSLETRAGGICR